ncbi:XRE family transcriptional regulator [Streptomyces sp. WAC02707]|uniref:helix-turn-helix domain-containing protein n=1 Tax=Streptomyces sp. WAC02707 TaxID=2487417 RepID=UPI000F782D98|nr:helix-turn-helix transcriptional regulator [Streptomyces sp. WAC02707]RSS92512.1 XRE family transcriptional regulator [Streptomyces sp. WAC02707]
MERPQPTIPVDGAEIRTRRKELGLSRDECAEAAGISGPYLSQLETGARRAMRPPTYKRLRTVLQIQQDDRQLLAPHEEPEHRKDTTDGRHEGAGRPHPDPG